MSRENRPPEQLRKYIVACSASHVWDAARQEWVLLTVYRDKNRCVCGVHIVNNCVIYNAMMNSTLVVGNVCINHFDNPLMAVSDSTLDALDRIRNNHRTNKASPELLELAQRTRVLTTGDAALYKDITIGDGARTRFNPSHDNYSQENFGQRKQLNVLLLMGFSKRRPICDKCGLYMMCRRRDKYKYQSTYDGYFYVCNNNGVHPSNYKNVHNVFKYI